jgi:hypothetical protein
MFPAGTDARGSGIGRNTVVKEPRVYVINPAARGNRSARNGSAKGMENIYSSPANSGSDSNEYLRNRQTPSLLLVLLSYILGPFALLVTREGRKNKVWLSVAIASGVASVLIVWRWKAILPLLEGRGVTVVPVVFFSSIVILTGLTAWARALLLMGRRNLLLPQILPKWIKRPGSIGAIGLVVPGLGLFIAGHPRRGTFACWMVGTLIVSALILSNAAWIWNLHKGAGIVASDALEIVFLVIAAVGLLGIATWIVQALDGVRLAEHRFARRETPRGDAAAFALLIAVVAFTAMFEPASVAETLDRFAVSSRHDGYRIIPLYAELAALRIDPSQPVFAARAAELYDEIGRHDRADLMRDELYGRWRLCEGVLRRSVPERREDTLPELGGPIAGPLLVEEATSQAGATPWDRIKAVYGVFNPDLDGE